MFEVQALVNLAVGLQSRSAYVDKSRSFVIVKVHWLFCVSCVREEVHQTLPHFYWFI